jgi:hypothetical protein
VKSRLGRIKISQEVLTAQQWLNSTYGSNPNYEYVEETGLPGTATSEALVSALQIELGISPVTDKERT